MNTNNFTIEDLEKVLTVEDKAYCDRLFQEYLTLQEIATEIFTDGNRRLREYDEANDRLFGNGSDILASQIEKIASSMEQITRTMVTNMESYFETRYSVEGFSSLLKSKSYKVSKMLVNYEPVIANMINVTALDFSKGNP